MIRFNCPNCGNEFAVRDTYAGRDGWCRVCKELVLVPTEDGKGPHLDDLPMEDRISRLRAKLKYAATQADTYKQIALRIWAEVDDLLLGRDFKDRKLTPEGIEESLAAWRAAWDARGAATSPPRADAGALETVQSEVSALRDALDRKSRAFAETNEEAERLRAAVAALEAEQARPTDPAPVLPSADGRVQDGEAEKVRVELSAARIALADVEAKKADTESALNVIHGELAAAQGEREEAQRATRVLQDEVESLRVELDAALYATSGQAAAGDVAGDDARDPVAEAQSRETALREELTAARLMLAEVDAKRSDAEGTLAAIGEGLAAAQAEREEARRTARVLQDELGSLRVELDAALYARARVEADGAGGAEVAEGGADGHNDAANGFESEAGPWNGAMHLPSMPAWHEAPVVVAPDDRRAIASADEMEVVEAEIEGLDPFENDAMMSSYLHFLSDAQERGK